MKPCKNCGKIKSIQEHSFYQRKMVNGSYKICQRIYCKSCEAEKAKLWRANNPEKVKSYNQSSKHKQSYQKWLSKNKDKRIAYQKQYYLDNIDKFILVSQTKQFKDKKIKYKINKKKTDPGYRLRNNISNSIYRALVKGKSNKAGESILKYLDYTIQDLKSHLENQFDNKMTWQNYGIYWHLDHIIPQSDLPYASMEEENFKICWSLKNLRPLEAKLNIIEGARRIRHKKLNICE